jgi:uncharacterized protein (DUF433 family)
MLDRIVSDPAVCGGEPRVRGTRVSVWIVLSHLAAGDEQSEILMDFPDLKPEDIHACLEYASFLAKERVA